MQPSGKEMQGMAASMNGMVPSAAVAADIALQEVQNSVGAAGQDEFFDQMMSSFASSWPPGLGRSLLRAGLKSPEEQAADEGMSYGLPYDESSLLTSRLRQHPPAGGGGPSPTGKLMLQQMLLQSMGQSPVGCGGDAGIFLPLPLSLGKAGAVDPGLLGNGSRDEVDEPFKSFNPSDADVLYNNGFRTQAPTEQQHFHHPHPQNYEGTLAASTGVGQASSAAAAASAPAGGGTAPPRPRVRARRGQATDPHSIAERLRRERIAERMKALQELVPNANKTDKASMLDEIIDYVKFLQLQVKVRASGDHGEVEELPWLMRFINGFTWFQCVLSMSRLGGAAAVAPLMADMSPECGGTGRGGGATGSAAAGNDGLTVAENQVAKLMEEDMGTAMQYLQGKGLCLMPISLASAISSATCHALPHPPPGGLSHHRSVPPVVGDAPSSPSMSVLTVQSTNGGGGSADADVSR